MLSLASPQRFRLRLPLTALLVIASTLLIWHLWSYPGSSADVESIRVETRPPPGAPTLHIAPPRPTSTSSSVVDHAPATPASPPSAESDQSSNAQLSLDPCQPLPGIEDVMVVLKTGATEMHQKVPVHFNTTLKCIPHFAIVSDMEEEISGHKVHNVLEAVSDEICRDTDEFALYRKMREYRALGKDILELVQTADDTKVAWNLDKWKFLPMMTKAYSLKDDAKWYVFVEADTYILYSNLMMWLEHLRHEKMWYIGGQSWIGDDVFAHGGTGFVISNPAMRKLTEMLSIHKKEMERMTRDEWAGDLVLAKALKSVGVTLSQTWPSFQGETPSTLDYTERHYCYPVVSYHHVDAEWIKFLWEFEKAWVTQNMKLNRHAPVRHRDAFVHLVEPYLDRELSNWDNRSGDAEEKIEPDTLAQCRRTCEKKKWCVQWRHVPGGTCKLSRVIRLGAQEQDPTLQSTSGWMTNRIEKFKMKMEPCKQEWIHV